MPSFFTTPDGARLAFLDQGAGRPVLCLAGLTRTMEDFDAALPALAGARVIRMDYRGRGASDWTGADSYSVAQEAADALALLDHLGIDRAAILGTSRGGLIGMHLARVAHRRLAGLCLVDIGPEVPAPAIDRIIQYVGRSPAARTHAEMAAIMPMVMVGFAGVSEARWLAEVRRFYQETPEGLRITYDPALRDAFIREFTPPVAPVWNDWAATTGLPVALIRGAGSDLLLPETVARMRKLRPDLILAEVSGRGHVPFLDEPESVAALHRWLEAMQ